MTQQNPLLDLNLYWPNLRKIFTVYRFKANYYQQRTFFALVFLQLTRDITSIYRQSAFLRT